MLFSQVLLKLFKGFYGTLFTIPPNFLSHLNSGGQDVSCSILSQSEKNIVTKSCVITYWSNFSAYCGLEKSLVIVTLKHDLILNKVREVSFKLIHRCREKFLLIISLSAF